MTRCQVCQKPMARGTLCREHGSHGSAYREELAARSRADAAERATWPKCIVPSCGTHVFEPGAKVCRLHQPRPPPPSIESFIRRPTAWMEDA